MHKLLREWPRTVRGSSDELRPQDENEVPDFEGSGPSLTRMIIRRGVENSPGEHDPNPHEARGDVERRGDGGSRGGDLSRRDGRRLARRGRRRRRRLDAAEQRVFRGEKRRHDDKRAAPPN